MRRRTNIEDSFDAIDVLLARRHLKHWERTTDRGVDCTEAHFRVLDLVTALRSLSRPLDDSEAECLRLADAAGV